MSLSGKSYLLVVLILFLTRLFDLVDPAREVKVMVACLTNVAVDGILLGLQRVGVDFIRVGSIRRVAPPIIGNMVHMTSGASTEEVHQQ